MKSNKLALYLLAILCHTHVMEAQEVMGVQQANGSTTEYDINDIDNVYFATSPRFSEQGHIIAGEEVDLGLSVNWSTLNVGATTPSEVGSYYAWGDVVEKNYFIYQNCATWDMPFSLNGGSSIFDIANMKLGNNWRMPTYEESLELIRFCTWNLMSIDGVKGYEVIGPNGNSIFLPLSGAIYGNVKYRLSDATFWCSDYANESGYWIYRKEAYALTYPTGRANSFYRFIGLPVRPVKNKTKN